MAKAKTKTEAVLKLSDLAEWQRNPRTISNEAIAALGKSIESFGDVSSSNHPVGALNSARNLMVAPLRNIRHRV